MWFQSVVNSGGEKLPLRRSGLSTLSSSSSWLLVTVIVVLGVVVIVVRLFIPSLRPYDSPHVLLFQSLSSVASEAHVLCILFWSESADRDWGVGSWLL